MSDDRLKLLLVDLADAIREIPESKEHQKLVDRFFVLIQHLEAQELIPRDMWNLECKRK